MIAIVRLIIRIYAVLLHLYPQSFRAEFEQEMQAVFAKAVTEAAGRGGLSLVGLCLREMRDWPGTILREHLQRRNEHVSSHTNEPVTWKPASRLALLVGLALFLIPVTYGMESLMPFAIIATTIVTLMAFVLLVSIVGLFKGLPRWSLPSVGALLSVFVLYGILDALGPQMLILHNRIVTVGDEFSRFVWLGIKSGISWFTLLLTVILVVLVLAAWRRTRPFYLRIRRDWTLVSLILYGACLPTLFINFDEYRYKDLYMAIALLSLAAGAWGCLRFASSRKRLLTLLAGASLAMSSMAVGKWIILPYQNWATWFSWHPLEVERWIGPMSTLVELGWMLVVISIPALLSLLPRPAQPVSSG